MEVDKIGKAPPPAATKVSNVNIACYVRVCVLNLSLNYTVY